MLRAGKSSSAGGINTAHEEIDEVITHQDVLGFDHCPVPLTLI
jgi:hypothetical protein